MFKETRLTRDGNMVRDWNILVEFYSAVGVLISRVTYFRLVLLKFLSWLIWQEEL